MKRIILWMVFVAVFFQYGYAAQAADRPESWAQLVEMDGVPNLFRVNNNLYRSAQPNEEGMRNLRRMGVKTVIDLRSFHWDTNIMRGLDLAYEHIYMKSWHPEQEDVVRFLKIVTDPNRTPVLVHCQHGADRTGTMCAIYRIVVDGWTKEDAVREMVEGDFGFHEIWHNLPKWILKLDVQEIKREAGIQ